MAYRDNDYYGYRGMNMGRQSQSNPFSSLQMAPYVSQYSPLPLDAFIKSAGIRRDRRMRTEDKLDAWAVAANKLMVNPGDEYLKTNALGEVEQAMEAVADNPWGAEDMVRNMAREFVSNPQLQVAQQNFNARRAAEQAKQEAELQGKTVYTMKNPDEFVSVNEDGSYNYYENPYSVALPSEPTYDQILKDLKEERYESEPEIVQDGLLKGQIRIQTGSHITEQMAKEYAAHAYPQYQDTDVYRQKAQAYAYQFPEANVEDIDAMLYQEFENAALKKKIDNFNMSYLDNPALESADPIDPSGGLAPREEIFYENEVDPNEEPWELSKKDFKDGKIFLTLPSETYEASRTADPSFIEDAFNALSGNKDRSYDFELKVEERKKRELELNSWKDKTTFLDKDGNEIEVSQEDAWNAKKQMNKTMNEFAAPAWGNAPKNLANSEAVELGQGPATLDGHTPISQSNYNATIADQLNVSVDEVPDLLKSAKFNYLSFTSDYPLAAVYTVVDGEGKSHHIYQKVNDKRFDQGGAATLNGLYSLLGKGENFGKLSGNTSATVDYKMHKNMNDLGEVQWIPEPVISIWEDNGNTSDLLLEGTANQILKYYKDLAEGQIRMFYHDDSNKYE